MKRREFSPTYCAILDLLHRTESINNNMYQVEYEAGEFKRNKLDYKTRRIAQEIVITDNTLFRKCTSAQWYLVGIISSELMVYNALWECESKLKDSSTIRQAIKGLIEMNILIKTETSHIYLVNPVHIRRGDFHTVLTTTASLLANSGKVSSEHISNKKPLTKVIFGTDDEIKDILLSEDVVGYGYVTDNTTQG